VLLDDCEQIAEQLVLGAGQVADGDRLDRASMDPVYPGALSGQGGADGDRRGATGAIFRAGRRVRRRSGTGRTARVDLGRRL
jgi:hypothetical protein